MLVALGLVASSLGAEFNRPALGSHAASSSRLTHTLNLHTIEEAGRFSRLQYDVTHQDRLYLHLDTDPSVRLLDCNSLFTENVLTVEMPIDYAASFLKEEEGVIVTGGRCPKADTVFTALHKTVKKPEVLKTTGNGVQLLLAVEEASYLDIYEDAVIHFHTNQFGRPEVVPEKSTTASTGRSLMAVDAETPVLGGWFKDAISKAWSTVKTIAADVQKALDVVKELTKVLEGEEFDKSVDLAAHTWSWNLDAGGKIVVTNTSLDPTVSCYNCRATCYMAVNFTLVIARRQLQVLSVVGHGDFDASVGLRADWALTFQKQFSKVLDTVKLPSLVFYIGPVPFTLKATIPIVAGYQLNVKGGAEVTATATCKGGFKAGIQYTSQHGIGFVNSHEFKPSGAYSHIGHVDFLGHVSITPSIQIQIDYIGGPSLGLNGYLEAGAAFGLDKSDVCYPHLAKITSSLGLEVTVGAAIDVKLVGVTLYHKDIFSKTIYSAKFPIVSACIGNSKQIADASMLKEQEDFERALTYVNMDRLKQGQASEDFARALTLKAPITTINNGDGVLRVAALVDIGCVEGTSWIGSVTRVSTEGLCAKYPSYRQFSVQSIESVNTGDELKMTVVLSGNDQHTTHNDSYACVYQAQYLSYFTKFGHVNFVRYASNIVDYTQCTHDNNSTAPPCTCTDADTRVPDKFRGNFTENMNKLMLEDPHKCTSIHLYRVLPSTSGHRFYSSNTTGNCGI